ncbi:MAG: hypothetical protein HFJ60_02255 [Clostridia bacterium]|jgi:hypothetical protein|nr:hypothetical protein [Clostridia bacterium]
MKCGGIIDDDTFTRSSFSGGEWEEYTFNFNINDVVNKIKFEISLKTDGGQSSGNSFFTSYAGGFFHDIKFLLN